MKYFLCLGSNSGDRLGNIEAALLQMKRRGLKIQQRSSLFKTEPVSMPGEPWFFNQVVEVETDILPADLLAWIKETERKMGRNLAEKLKSRIIDMDILLAEDRIVRTSDLQVPHLKLAERNFVLIPLAEIAPEVIHPILNTKICDLLQETDDTSQVKIINESR